MLDQPIGRLARDIPGATRIFREHRLDFCCGGQRPLGEMLAELDINPLLVLPELQRLAADVPDGSTPGSWSDADNEALINHILQRYHQRHREQVLFPLMLDSRAASAAVAPIVMMRAEHDEHGKTLLAIEKLTNDIALPSGACTTWRALYSLLGQFRDDLIDHIHLENNLLFPRAELHAHGECQ